MAKQNTTDRISKLRELMKNSQYNVHAYIVPSEDAHQSEYIAACDGRRAYISGFTGSAGVAVITLDQAALWTDGRYFLQASQQLDDNWTLMKSGLPETPSKEDWLNQTLPSNSRVGIDPTLISVSEAKTLTTALSPNHTLVPIAQNLIDSVWADTRPKRPSNPVMVLDLKYTGKSFQQKLEELRETLKSKKNVEGIVVAALDEIAWLYNLRGSDIVYNPVFFAYSVVTLSDATLFVDESKLSKEVKDYLGKHVQIRPYQAIFEDLKVKVKTLGEGKKLLIDARTNLALRESIGQAIQEETRSPITVAKAIKTSAELSGFRACHIRDAAALVSFFAWLEDELVFKKNTNLDEVDVADKLEDFRSRNSDFIGLSFDTISGVGSNGAIIHYKPEKSTAKKLKVNEMYLCDSGAQYRDGTTDVTRTLHFGVPTDFEKQCFTRVLKGHIALDKAIFPKGTTGYILDVLSRTSLWEAGLDYRHGTGHGVGAFLNVHEGPHGIGTRIAYNDVALQPGMTVTNEPGYYHDGHFGIRIENIMLVVPANTPNTFGNKPYYTFEHVTLVPICRKLIDTSMLTREEVDWINNYHDKCWEKVSPLLKVGTKEYKWLRRETMRL
ncbi:putative Xaa-Pro aminopeptidase P [Paraphysoderma sedebokerense]|nr:putative Xaa-Pro aminopeptidase P [Paraphysoderma sedebokerense]